MISKDNVNIKITISKRQLKWLNEASKRIHLTKSKLIKWMLAKNIANLLNKFSDEDINYLTKIAKTPWLEEDDD